ncbi:MAG: hypothetical protein K9G26_03870 [Emcibacter sp.]|nr:hypothetical protein [Emcibacter sp.]
MSFGLNIYARAETEIIDVRTGLHPNKTRIVLEINQVTFYQIRYLDGSDDDHHQEIVIDFLDMPNKDDVSALARKAEVIGLLNQISVEDNKGKVRLRVSLRKPATVDKSYILKPDYGKQYRLVFDVKSVSEAEWARQVILTAPPVPIAVTVSEEEPYEEIPESKSITPDIEPIEEHAESYDNMMTDNSNFILSGYMEMETRGFTQSSFRPEQKDWTASVAVEPLLEYVSDSNSSLFSFQPFGRFDVNDKARSHFDIRKLKWTGTMDRLQLTLGINTVFWGVTESNHLVDILNQDDNLEDIDQEDKLGQPMAALSYSSDFGVFSVYLMTYFRELRYPGAKGRFSMALPVDYAQTQYEAGSGKWHTDYALRWSHVIGNIDVGLYHFRGTNREPELLLGKDSEDNDVLIPRYNLINQTGLDMQGTFEDLLIKFEAIRRTGSGPDYWAMTGGFEYSFYGLGGGDSDIGVLVEYLYDDRGANATTPFEDDIFTGMRWAANDINSTELLAGIILDLDTSAKFVNVEGSRRIGDNWKISVDARFFLGVPMTDIIYPFSRNDFFQIRLARYF